MTSIATESFRDKILRNCGECVETVAWDSVHIALGEDDVI
jgi:hypothetical protein